ncbi:MAG: MarR family transcriptional regulator [Confluentimicrobium sp.]|jgi:DNA-binding MarR family transcriptional regulator|uniref:MarR family winged helix-turn-helix transcriptional regulator n=1 Tax=Actibacterium sp. TaxID=1872125 RepID=UPI00050F7A82|nr:MarR family transcriptional regulator [Actibacterium sp.]KGB82834.1 hypothetical protein JT55_05195 [Rhodovulum sp. NI22]MBC58540.1 MarR family transcriptional regulator [Actibacterium sp.]MDY6858103.1 MarR family transcriptional regulator [Pseudomonadota bacterium]|tara:strand:- start:2366 stop:2839 length:474 start_codon:yes stop_codon:yes gene_type:complete
MLPPARESLAYIFLDLTRLFRAEFEHRVARAGLGITPAEARILSALRRFGPVRQNILADRLGIAKMSATNFIDSLEAAGLVMREADPDDRRAKLVSLTDAADPILSQLATIGAETRSVARGGMSDAAWQAFTDAARETRRNLLEAREDREKSRRSEK